MFMTEARRASSSTDGETITVQGIDDSGALVSIAMPVNQAAMLADMIRAQFETAGYRRMALRDMIMTETERLPIILLAIEADTHKEASGAQRRS